MPPPVDDPALHLIALPKAFYVIQFPQRETIPADVISELTFGKGEFFSITRTTEEVSVVGELDERSPEICKPFATWGCIRVRGPMEHSLTGIMASLAAPLKEAQIPIFALSTWNTDWLLVPATSLDKAVETLQNDGWSFAESVFQ